VCDLDNGNNTQLGQNFIFDGNFTFMTPVAQIPPPPTWTVSFNFAARDGKPLKTSTGDVFWNDEQIGSILPNNYNVTLFTKDVIPRLGQNTLRIVGTGPSDGFGATIDNVVVNKYGSSQNVVVNPGFEMTRAGWFKRVPGWVAFPLSL
jgi:hypothetical protein